MAGIFKKSKRLEDVLEKQMELNCKIGDKFLILLMRKLRKTAGSYTESRNIRTTNISHIFWKVSWKKSRNIGTTIIYMHIQV